MAEIKTDEIIMALGVHLKSTIAYLPNDNLYISQYLGNLDHFDVYERFEKNAISFTDLFEQKPNMVLTDKHPSYQSSLFGEEISKEWKAVLIKIQHHKAHFASVLGEHDLFDDTEKVLGVVWDGTGYGDDGQIWGGEFFNYQSKKIKRVTHFTYFDWLAGDKMAKEPRLCFLSLADSSIQKDLAKKFTTNELNIYQSIKKTNQLKTSSVGRLFDAVASLLNICDLNTYEGEAAILLENRITDYDLNQCRLYFNLMEKGNIDTAELFNNLYSDYKDGQAKDKIIVNFLFTLATIILKVAEIQDQTKIALSGGVFQNTVLIDMLKELSQNKFELFFNRNLAPNDENISYGQIMYYLNCK
jgi:hydrogenase maturation protein HypF